MTKAERRALLLDLLAADLEGGAMSEATANKAIRWCQRQELDADACRVVVDRWIKARSKAAAIRAALGIGYEVDR